MSAGKTVQVSLTERLPTLEHVAGPMEGQISEVRMDIVAIGRTEDNDVVLSGEGISRCHAFMKKTEQGWLVQDNRSKNGIFVNGLKVVESLVNHGDVIQIGDFAFRFVLPEDAPNTVSPKKKPKAAPARANKNFVKQLVVPLAVETERPAPPPPASPSLRVEPPPPAPVAQAQQTIVPVRPTVVTSQPFRYASAIDAEKHLRLQWILGGIAVGITVCIAGWMILHRGSRSSERVPQPVSAPPPVAVAPPPPLIVAPPPPPPVVIAPPPPPVVVAPPPPPAPSIAREDMEVRTTKRRGARDDKKELAAYLREGRDYLKENDFESAAIAFRFALVLDPNNVSAIEGLRAVEYRGRAIPQTEKRGIAEAPPAPVAPARAVVRKPAAKKEPTDDRRRTVEELLKAATKAFGKRSYQEAIDAAERVRGIEIRGETGYLNEAKQILDRARARQKEDYEPFILQAREKIDAGDYAGGLALCEEMLRTDPSYKEAKQCQSLARDGMEGRRR